MTRELLAHVARHSWPGNVRELRNYLERCLALEEMAPLDGAVSTIAATGVDLSRPMRVGREQVVRDFERRYLEEVLRQQEGNVTAAARVAGVDRAFFYRLLARHGLR
jgi:DNA-binding NtrC family response regulator